MDMNKAFSLSETDPWLTPEMFPDLICEWQAVSQHSPSSGSHHFAAESQLHLPSDSWKAKARGHAE